MQLIYAISSATMYVVLIYDQNFYLWKKTIMFSEFLIALK